MINENPTHLLYNINAATGILVALGGIPASIHLLKPNSSKDKFSLSPAGTIPLSREGDQLRKRQIVHFPLVTVEKIEPLEIH